MGAEFTLGAEEELHLIDTDRWELSARAPQILSRLPSEFYSAEIQRTTVETNTAVVRSLTDLREELLRLRQGVIEVAAKENLGVAAVGTAPRSTYRDVAVEVGQRIARDLPVLLALSASSPYWNGQDTGYASIRTIIWQRWPSAGSPGRLSSAAEYDQLVADLISSGVIADAKMAYFDVRPSAHAPTLELRVCDACPLVDDAVLIAGLFRALARAAELDIEAGRPSTTPPAPLHRAAMWQAARSGLSRSLVDHEALPRPANEVVRDLVARLRPQLEESGDWDTVSDLAEAVLARGNSADRQRAAFAEGGRLEDVMSLVVDETHGASVPTADAPPALSRYRARAGDEAVGRGAIPRPAYRDIVGGLLALG